MATAAAMIARMTTAAIGGVVPNSEWKSDRRAISRPARSNAVKDRTTQAPARAAVCGERNTEVIAVEPSRLHLQDDELGARMIGRRREARDFLGLREDPLVVRVLRGELLPDFRSIGP